MRAPKMAAPTWLPQNGRPHNMVAAVAYPSVGFGLCDGRWAAWPGICCIALRLLRETSLRTNSVLVIKDLGVCQNLVFFLQSLPA